MVCKKSYLKGLFKPVFLIVLYVTLGLCPAEAAEKDQKLESMSTTIRDQTGVAVTIYNVNLGLVKDVREVDLAEGMSELRFMDVASEIMPASVFIKSLKDSGSLSVLEQNYEYDLLNAQKLLDKYVGRNVKLYSMNPYTERENTVEATVLSNNAGPIFRIGDDITYGHPGRIIFPGVPDDLISQPTLVWLLDNSLSSVQTVEASYLTNGINWEADYVVTLDENDEKSDIAGWVTINNRSGTTYKNAQLKLVAGDVSRVKDQIDRHRMEYAEAARMAKDQFKEDEFFEYHLYTLQRPSTIKNNQTKQIRLLQANSVPVMKELVFHGSQHYFRNKITSGMTGQKVAVYIEIANKKESGLGMPLPKGTVKVYKHDKEGSLQFVGENRIDHTPKDEKIRIKLGDAFDVVGSRKQMSWEKMARDTYETSFEIELRNHKQEDVNIKVIEPIPGDWEMIDSSHNYTKTEAFTAEFNVLVPKDEEVKITYKVLVRY